MSPQSRGFSGARWRSTPATLGQTERTWDYWNCEGLGRLPSTLLVMLSALWLAPPSCDGAEPPGDRVPGLIRALERLDADSDGRLETSEIPDLARPHIQIGRAHV